MFDHEQLIIEAFIDINGLESIINCYDDDCIAGVDPNNYKLLLRNKEEFFTKYEDRKTR